MAAEQVGAAAGKRFGGSRVFEPADAAAAFGEHFGLGHAEQAGQRIVDAAGRGVKVCVHTDGRDPVLQQQRRYITGLDPLEGVEDDRVVGHNQFAAVLRGFGHDGRGDIQRRRDAADRAAGVNQQADVIPVAGKLDRGVLLQNLQHALNRYGHSKSSICCSSASTASASGPAGRPRRYFCSLKRCSVRYSPAPCWPATSPHRQARPSGSVASPV